VSRAEIPPVKATATVPLVGRWIGLAFVRRLAPEPRRTIRRALRDLALGKGDIRQLEPPLEGYSRLRIGAYRAGVGAEESAPCAATPLVGSGPRGVILCRARLDPRGAAAEGRVGGP